MPSSYTVNNQKLKVITKYFVSTVYHYITMRFLLFDNRAIVINWCVNIWCLQLSQCLLLTVLSILREHYHFPPFGLSPEGRHFPPNPPYLACKQKHCCEAWLRRVCYEQLGYDPPKCTSKRKCFPQWTNVTLELENKLSLIGQPNVLSSLRITRG